jgi:N-acetyl-1-D-myo-inositol-2-amino-2-deoxy-alpha-D-glucopyranoside deacetylase
VTAPSRRLLLVHAHPDDETINNGATMARYVAEGAGVTLLTCTLGEEGEVLVPELAGLAADQADQLGGYRMGEIAAAMAALGVTDHRWLGGAGRYRDSGMMGTPANDHPRAFWNADLDEAVAHAVAVVREVRPQVVVTYDPNGGYGHPDHIQAHRVAMRAVELAGDDAPTKVYWTAVPNSVLQGGIEAFAGAADNPFGGITEIEQLPFGTPDEQIAAAIHAPDQADRKTAALRAHATQIPPDSWLYTLASSFGAEFMGLEHFVLARGVKGPGEGRFGWENDLFAGIDARAALV